MFLLTQYYNSPNKVIKLLIIWSLIGITITGCKYNNSSQEFECKLSSETYKELINTKGTDSNSINKLTTLFLNFKEGCKNQESVGDSVLMNLFYSWIADPAKNAYVPAFFINSSINKGFTYHFQVQSSLYLSIIYIAEYNLEKSDSIIAKLNNELNKLDKKNTILLYRNQGLIYNLKNKLDEATLVFQKAIDLVQSSEKIDNCELGNIYGNYGNVYMKLGDYSKAIELIKKSCSLIEQCNTHSNDLGAATSNLGVAYNFLHKSDSALFCFKKVLAYNKNNTDGDRNNALAAYTNIVGLLLKDNQYDSAQYYTREAELLSSSIADSSRLMLLYLSNTICKAANSDVSTNIKKIKEFLPQLYKNNDLYNIQICLQSLSKIYQLKGDYNQAFIYENQQDSIREIATSTDYRIHINEVENKYQITKKNAEIKEKAAEIKYSRVLLMMSIAIVVILFLSLTLKIQNIKKRKRDAIANLTEKFAHQLIEETEEERSKIAMELHDDINQDLMLLKKEIGNTNTQWITKMDLIINKVRQISRSIYPVTLSYIGLEESISNLAMSLSNSYDILITTDIAYTKEISLQIQLQIFRIVQEAFNNLIKHSEASAALLTLKECEKIGGLELCIKDNGVGFNVEANIHNKNSFGLHSIYQRANLLGGSSTIECNEEGTTITILIPF